MSTALAQSPIGAATTVQPGSSTEGLEQLDRGLAGEAGLLHELRDGLVAQREALAANDTAALEQVVNQIGRTLLTIREARRQRALLIEMIVGEAGAGLGDVSKQLDEVRQARFRARCQELHDLAVSVSRELRINQSVIRRAIESGERFLQHLLSIPMAEGYSTRPPDAQSGWLLNQSA